MDWSSSIVNIIRPLASSLHCSSARSLHGCVRVHTTSAVFNNFHLETRNRKHWFICESSSRYTHYIMNRFARLLVTDRPNYRRRHICAFLCCNACSYWSTPHLDCSTFCNIFLSQSCFFDFESFFLVLHNQQTHYYLWFIHCFFTSAISLLFLITCWMYYYWLISSLMFFFSNFILSWLLCLCLFLNLCIFQVAGFTVSPTANPSRVPTSHFPTSEQTPVPTFAPTTEAPTGTPSPTFPLISALSAAGYFYLTILNQFPPFRLL